MASLVIRGGKKLSGEVFVSGSKNAALPILAATILLDTNSTIHNIPNLTDIRTMIRVLRSLGIRTEYVEPNMVKTWGTNRIKHVAPYDLVTRMRASFFVAGPILARNGLAKVPLPGGCAIGTRPVDIHLRGFQAMGTEVNIEHGFVELKAKKLKGDKVYLDFPSVGATENIMMAAALAKGTTIIENAAQEPEIVDLAGFLNMAGAKINGAGTNVIEVEGVSNLRGIEYDVIPDRIETGTLVIAAAITHGEVTVKNSKPEHIVPVIQKLKEIGVDLEVEDRDIKIKKGDGYRGIDFETMPYPGFPTDMQAQMMALLSVSQGISIVKETVFENRFMHAQELNRMGARIRIKEHSAIIEGVEKLSGAPVKTTDLRAGAALVIAGLAADGETVIYGTNHIIRGYDRLPEKLLSLGADIEEI